MARLRIRIELNRGGVGVPLQKLASVVTQAQKFFHMVGDDIAIDQTSGEWLGFDFDHESLNFTAEFVGRVTPEQVSAFNAAFDGTTSLRRATIAQFARITDAIEEDELIGFGLYLNESGTEPGEWRCLSRRDALRIAEGIRLLIGADEEIAPESHLPVVSDLGTGARLFSERRGRAIEPTKWAGIVREVEATLSRRIGKLETEVEGHSESIEDLRTKSATSEASIGRLVSAVEVFCEQATRRLEALPAAALSAATPEPVSAPEVAPLAKAASEPAHAIPILVPAPELPSHGRWTPLISIAAAGALILLSALLWNYHSDDPPKTEAAAPAATTVATVPTIPAPADTVAPVPAKPESVKPQAAKTGVVKPAIAKTVAVTPPGPQAGQTTGHIDIEASEPTWVSVTEEGGNKLMSRVLQPSEVRSLDLSRNTVLVAGNAAGLAIRFNGKPIGAIGPHGSVREVQFKDGTYRIVTPGN